VIDLAGKVAIVTGAASFHGDPELPTHGQGSQSAVQEVSSQFGLRCVSILTLSDLIESFGNNAGDPVRISREQYAALQAYQQAWGAIGISGGAGAGAQ